MSFKRLLTLLVVAFLLFFIVHSPSDAARVVKTAGESLGRTLGVLADGLSEFLRSLV